MKRYLVRIMFYIDVETLQGKAQFDEQLRLIHAKDKETALLKAKTIGKKEEELIINNQTQKIHWKFVCVQDIFPLEEMLDGEEVLSYTHEKEDRAAFINYIQYRGAEMQVKEPIYF